MQQNIIHLTASFHVRHAHQETCQKLVVNSNDLV